MSNFRRWHFTHELLNCLIDSVLKITANFKTNFYGALISVTLYSVRPRPHVCGYFWKRIFFLRFSLPPTNVNAVFGTKNVGSLQWSPELSVSKTVDLSSSCEQTKTPGRFSTNYDVIHRTAQGGMPCKDCYCMHLYIGPVQTYPFLCMRSINKTTTRYVSSVYRYYKTATWNILMRRYLEDDGLFFLFRKLKTPAENSRGLFTSVEWVVVCWTFKLSLERSALCPPKNSGVLTPKVCFLWM